MKYLVTLVVLLVLLGFGISVAAQESTGGIEGTVKDSSGAVVPNIAVTITTAMGSTPGKSAASATGTGFKRTLTTDGEGFFRALQIPPGTYDVTTASTGGFGEARYENVTVAIGINSRLEVVVNPGSSVVTVDVNASDAAPVDATNNAIQTSVNARKIELIPRGVDFSSVLKTVPGTRPESRTGGFSIDGASGGENVFVIDGQEVTNFRTGTLNLNNNIPTQLVQELQVKSSGFGAEFGGATGGVVSVVTKGGSNDFHGEFGIQFEPQKLTGEPRPILQRFSSGSGASFVQTTEYINPPRNQGVNVFPTANLGGPILKNKLYFYGSYTPLIFDTETTTFFYSNSPAATRQLRGVETFRRKRTVEYAFGRLDASPTEKLRLTGTFLWNPVVDQGNLPFGTVDFGSFVPAGTANNPNAGFTPPTFDFGGSIGRVSGREFTDRQGGRQTSNNVTAQAVYTATSSLIFSGRFSRGFLNEKLGNYFVPPGIQINCRIGNTPANPNQYPGGCQQAPDALSNSEIFKDASIRINYELDGTYLFNFAGRHELKGGYQRFNISNDVFTGNVSKGRIDFSYGKRVDEIGAASVVASGPICATGQTTGCILGAGILRRVGTIGKAANLNQSLYIQDKYQPVNRLTLNLGVRIEKEDLPSFNGFAPPINFGWGDKIAPRLGFAYDIFGDGRTKVFASYGQFYDRLKFNLPRGSFGGDIQLLDYFEILPGEVYTQYNIQNIVGGFTGTSICPVTGTIASGARSRCQQNQRLASNDPNSTITNGGRVDPDLKPFRQTEFTVGAERQFARDYVLRARYTFKNVDSAVEDAGVRNQADSEAYIIGNPGEGLHLQLLTDLGYAKSAKPQRRYDGLEFVVERRLSNNWYFNANYTYSRLYGNYSGLVSSDEINQINGRLAPATSRAFDLPFIGFTATGEPDNGRLETDRPHVFNAYGAYVFDWLGSKSNSTEFSAFQTVTSGTPQTTRIFLVSVVTPAIFLKRGDLDRSPTYSQTDFNVTHRYRFGRDDRFTLAGDLSVLNLFDQDTVTNLFVVKNLSSSVITGGTFGYPTPANGAAFVNAYTSGSLLAPINNFLDGTPTNLDRKDARYGQPNTFQSPRSIRFGFRVLF